jgi:hypothetical protein
MGMEGTMKRKGRYGIRTDDGIEILDSDRVTVYLALEEDAPGFVVSVFTDVARVVDGAYAQEGESIY